jgi:hypothetical protein
MRISLIELKRAALWPQQFNFMIIMHAVRMNFLHVSCLIPIIVYLAVSCILSSAQEKTSSVWLRLGLVRRAHLPYLLFKLCWTKDPMHFSLLC